MQAYRLGETIEEQLANGRHRHQIITDLVAAGLDRDEVSSRVLQIERAKRLVLRNRERRQDGARKIWYGAGTAVLGVGLLIGVKLWLGTVGPYAVFAGALFALAASLVGKGYHELSTSGPPSSDH